MSRFANPTTQYLDDAGNPLVSGKLYFFESDTDTPKATYADVNLSIANTHPVILTGSGRVPNIFFDGTARVKLTDSDDVQIFDKDPVGGDDAGGNFDEWSPLIIYSENSIVAGSDGNFYIPFISGNEGNDPTITPSAWQQIEFINIWNTNVTYDIGDTVKASDNLFYIALTEPNQGNDPTSSPSDWGPPFTGVATVVAGTNIIVDATDPENPIVINDGVLSVVGGTGITVDITDPNNPEVSADNNGTVTSVATSGLATGGPIIGTGTVDVAKGTGAEIDTGTEDAKAVTPKAVSDAIGSSIQGFDADTTKNDTANTFTKTQTWTKGGDVASVAALILGDGNYFDITGTTTITSIGTKGVGTTIKLHFDDALTLTHSATDLILPGAANITTAAGDEFEFTEYAAGDWRCTGYALASGEAISGVATDGVAKAWANLNGTGVIALNDSFNVSGVVDNGTGDYSFSYTNSLANTGYSFVAHYGSANSGNAILATYESKSTLRTVSSTRVYAGNNAAAADADSLSMTIHGDLA